MHGGNEVIMLCIKYMTEELAEEFVRNTDEVELGRSLQKDPLDSHGIDSEIMSAFDASKRSHYVEVRFYTEIEDMDDVEKWCAAEGFEVIEKTFGSHV